MIKQGEMRKKRLEKISEKPRAFWDLTPHYYQEEVTIEDIEKVLYDISYGEGEKEKGNDIPVG